MATSVPMDQVLVTQESPFGFGVGKAVWPIAPVSVGAGIHAIWPGLAVGALLILSMAMQQDQVAHLLALTAVLIAFALPFSGLALVALLVPLHDVELFGPIAFDVMLISAFALGQLCRVAIDPPRVRVSIGVILVAGYVVLSALTLVPALTGYGWNQTSSSIAQFMGMVAGFALVGFAALAFARRDSRPILATLLLSATIASVVALAAFLIGQGVGMPIRGLISNVTWDTRAFGPFFNSNYLGFFVTQSLILALGWAIVSSGSARLGLTLVAAISAMTLMATFSRGSLIGAGAGIVVLTWLHHRRLAVLAVAVLITGWIFIYPALFGARLDITYGDTSSQAFLDTSESDQWRLATVAAGIGLFASAPVFGVGYGAFHFLSPWFVGGSPVTYAHDWYVNVLAEQGIIGIVAFAAIVTWLVVAISRSDHPLRRTALALVAAYAVSSFFIDSVPAVAISLVAWLTAAAVLAPRILDGEQPAELVTPIVKAVWQTRELMSHYRVSARHVDLPSPRLGR